MTEPYLGLKWLHLVAACVAFGSNITHIFWLVSAQGDPVNRARILKTIKTIDDRLSVPAYVVTILAGAVMWLWRWPLDASWVIASIVLTALLAVMGILYGPVMKKWIRLAEARPWGDEELAALARNLIFWWAVISLSVLVILYLMVRKPALW